MKKQILTILAGMMTILCLAQNNFYVSTTGNNFNNGSMALPWQTIQYGVTQLNAGDTLNIMVGSYVGKIDLSISGSSGQKITIRNHNNDNVIIEGSSLNNFEYLLKIENVDYINITGIKFQDYQKLDAIGILIINSSNISILNNEFSNIDYSPTANGQTPNSSQNSQPIIVFGRDPLNPINNLEVNGNVIHDCEVGYSECLSINGNIDGFELLNNHIYDNTNIALVAIGHEGECPDPQFDQARNGLIKGNNIHDNPSAYAAAGGIYIDGGKTIVVENNISYNNDYGIEIGCENNGSAPNDPSASDITVRNNLIYNNKIAGIAFGGYDYPTSGKVETTTISNNTCFNNDTDNSYNGELLISYVENSSIENNIFYTNNTEKVLVISDNANPSLSLNYNLYFTPSGSSDIVIEINGTEYNEFSTYQMGTSQDANSVFANPQFVSETIPNPDLHINAASAAKDAGNPSFVPGVGETDMDGESRVQNSQVDMGADEYSLPLPVEYISPFQAIVYGDYIELKWVTATEINNAEYIVQHSVDAIEWEELMTIKGNGSTSSTSHYRALDTAPIAGTSYYRLKQVDLDGHFEYSNIAQVWWEKTWSEISVSPNPTMEKVRVEFYSPKSDKLIIQIFNTNGKLKFQRANVITEHLEIDVSNWESGVYLVQMISDNRTVKNIRLIIAR